MKGYFFFFVILFGMVWTIQSVQAEGLSATEAENVAAEDGALEGNVEEEGTALEEGEEGDITERGVRRFKLKPRKRILVPKTCWGNEQFQIETTATYSASGKFQYTSWWERDPAG